MLIQYIIKVTKNMFDYHWTVIMIILLYFYVLLYIYVLDTIFWKRKQHWSNADILSVSTAGLNCFNFSQYHTNFWTKYYQQNIYNRIKVYMNIFKI